ncbi:MAG: class I SAM-dependent methyltransferase [Candidatus Nealsonbacteria bacterium]|nr:class I SAM-dependent methyltransferase [Candidatus Nealsonbacteria bacterium]
MKQKRKTKTRSTLQNAEPAVREFLSSVGFSEPVSWERFLRDVESRFGKAGQDVLKAIDLRADGEYPDDDFYHLKNGSLSLSLAVTFGVKGGFYASFLSWLLRVDLPSPSRILDVGCDNGVLTCFYARQFPDAEVIGIDLHEKSIDRAKELAAKTAVPNVSFRVLDLKRADKTLLGSTFDLVTATHAIEIDLEGCRHVSSIGEVEQLEIASRDLETLAGVRRMVTPGSGLLLTANSFDDRAIGFWTRLLDHAGFAIDWARSSILDWRDGDNEKETCPVFVAENKDGGESWTVDDAAAFCASPAFIEKTEPI